jgi:hypothetical protein
LPGGIGGRTDQDGTRDDWKPVATSRRDPEGLPLTPIDAYLLSRIDGVTSVGELALISGMPSESLWAILDVLAREGMIEAPPPVGDVPAPAAEATTSEDPTHEDPKQPDDPTTPEDPATPSGTHRQLFETQLHSLPEDARAALASSAEDPELSALCFDPVPSVVRAVMDNPRAGLAHARLIAAHHGNTVGLDALGESPALLQDTEIQRLLLRNPQTSAPLLQRLLSRRRLGDIYNATQSRELPERNRTGAMQLLRRRFSEVSAEERVELIIRTEGRALAALSGLSLDGKSAALLCARTFTSMMIVENLARWPATPPPVILHLLKQPLLRQMPALRSMLKRHPNCPASAR